MGISLLDLVTEHQSGEENTLKRIVEESGQSYDTEGSGKPVQLDERIFLWERKEDILDKMPEATYVIIDAMYFSTTSIELFSKGLESMKLCETHDEVREQDVELKIGEGRDDTSMKDGMQMINSPTYVSEKYDGQKKSAMISYNGARAALRVIKGTEDSRIMVGSATNAKALAEKLSDEDEIHLVSSGSGGVHRAEDHIAAYIITQEFEDELDETEEEMLKRMIDLTAELEYEGDIPERRRKDIEVLKNINARDVVPEYDRGKGVLTV